MVKQLNDTFSYYSDSYSTMETLPLISSDTSNMTLLQIARGNEKGGAVWEGLWVWGGALRGGGAECREEDTWMEIGKRLSVTENGD